MLSISPSAGSGTGIGISTTTSGSRPFCHPAAKFGGGGRSLSSPRTAPPSTQATTVSMSLWLRLRSFLNVP